MLHVDEQEIIAGGLHDPADVDRARLAQADPQRQLASRETFLGVIADRDNRGASLIAARTEDVDSAAGARRTRSVATLSEGEAPVAGGGIGGEATAPRPRAARPVSAARR